MKMRDWQGCFLVWGWLCCCAAEVEGGIWVEMGDAGALPGTAQVTRGIGNLDSIEGEIDNVGFEDIDMFQLRIINTDVFSAALSSPALGGLLDTYLFLFDSGGLGVVADNDSETYPFDPISEIPVGTLSGHPTGTYYLAVSTAFSDGDLPLDGAGSLIFDPEDLAEDSSFVDPDFGSGTVSPESPRGSVTDWQLDLDDSDDGPYQIALTGATYSVIPEPASLAVWSLIAMVIIGSGWWRRRTP